MKRLLDKLFLFLSGLMLIIDIENFAKPVFISVIAFIFACVLFYSDSSVLHTVVNILFVVLCLLVPEFLFYLPLIMYDSFLKKQYIIYLGALSLFLNLNIFSNARLSIFVLACALSIYLAYRTSRLEDAEHKLILLRDTSTELNDMLKQKNKDLMEKQDYEVHLATLRERNRIAREIHDNVGHMLSRSILQMGALTTIHKEEPLNEQLKSINDTLNNAMTSIRESVHDLHDDSIDLKQAITEITDSVKDRYQINLDYDMSLFVPRSVKYCLISVLREAISNVSKHSNADSILIILREHPAFYQMSIEDNGTNIDKIKESGIGLANMRDRVDALGGTFSIRTEKGFHIFISIPKKEEA